MPFQIIVPSRKTRKASDTPTAAKPRNLNSRSER